MIHLADAALVAWLSTIDPALVVGIGGGAADEAGGASPRPAGAALDLELLRISEQAGRRDNEVRDIRDADGRVVERRRSTRWFELDYRCGVSGDRAAAHRVLGAIVQLLVDHDVVPAAHVPVDLVPDGSPVTVQIVPDDRSLGQAGIVLRLVVPVRPTAERNVAPPAVVLHFDVAVEPGREQTDPATAPAPPVRAWTTVRRREFVDPSTRSR